MTKHTMKKILAAAKTKALDRGSSTTIFLKDIDAIADPEEIKEGC